MKMKEKERREKNGISDRRSICSRLHFGKPLIKGISEIMIDKS